MAIRKDKLYWDNVNGWLDEKMLIRELKLEIRRGGSELRADLVRRAFTQKEVDEYIAEALIQEEPLIPLNWINTRLLHVRIEKIRGAYPDLVREILATRNRWYYKHMAGAQLPGGGPRRHCFYCAYSVRRLGWASHIETLRHRKSYTDVLNEVVVVPKDIAYLLLSFLFKTKKSMY